MEKENEGINDPLDEYRKIARERHLRQQPPTEAVITSPVNNEKLNDKKEPEELPAKTDYNNKPNNYTAIYDKESNPNKNKENKENTDKKSYNEDTIDYLHEEVKEKPAAESSWNSLMQTTGKLWNSTMGYFWNSSKTSNNEKGLFSNISSTRKKQTQKRNTAKKI